MFRPDNTVISSNISKFQVIINDSDNFDISGILYNNTYHFAMDFNGIRQMLKVMEEFFDYVNFPRATHEKRTFDTKAKGKKAKKPDIREVEPTEMADMKPSFILHVQFRQYSTWQGTLYWIAENKTKRFRSELEMIRLMAEAIEMK